MDFPELVYLSINSTVTSVTSATNRITTNPGTMPSTFIVAGTDMIPAPIMVVDMLNTAPLIDPFGALRCSAECPHSGDRSGWTASMMSEWDSIFIRKSWMLCIGRRVETQARHFYPFLLPPFISDKKKNKTPYLKNNSINILCFLFYFLFSLSVSNYLWLWLVSKSIRQINKALSSFSVSYIILLIKIQKKCLEP